MFEVCTQHQNKIQRVCLDYSCSSRVMCLLCEHMHGNQFQSIMKKRSENYKYFQNAISNAIDRYFFELKNSEQQKIKQARLQMLNKYFEDIQKIMQKFMDHCRTEALKKLQSDEQVIFQVIKRARVDKNYVKVSSNIFQILLKVYEGMPFSQIFKNNQSFKSEEAYANILKFHKELTDMMQSRHFKLKTKLPDIRKAYMNEAPQKIPPQIERYEQIDNKIKVKYHANLKQTFSVQFDSIITDSIKVRNHLLVISYDKKLRVINDRGQLVNDIQYGNVLSRIESIADDTYAIARSKQIVIDKIAPASQKSDEKVWLKQNIMTLKGHSERINDIHYLNTRIIGSSSLQGVKLWDLYKQKCQYTLKDQGNPMAIRFLQKINQLAVGINSHIIKVYSVQTMKIIKKYQLHGVPLMIDQGKLNEQTFFVGGFSSHLSIIDLRLDKLAFSQDFKSDAITCIAQSLHDQYAVIFGQRSGIVNIFDMRTNVVRFNWLAHQSKTNLSKPKGIVRIYQQNQDQYLTVGCNQKNVKLWQINKIGD